MTTVVEEFRNFLIENLVSLIGDELWGLDLVTILQGFARSLIAIPFKEGD